VKRWLRVLLRVAAFLLLIVAGAIANVAVAWGCAAWSPLTVVLEKVPTADEGWLNSLSRDDWSWRTSCGIGYQEFRRVELLRRRDEVQSGADMQQTVALFSASQTDAPWLVRSGWPCFAVISDMNLIDSSDRRYPTGWKVAGWLPGVDQYSHRRLSVVPIWPGFAINTLFYAVILWMLFAAPFALRRRRRVKRGLCPKCAYDLRGRAAESDACPECGAPVPRQVSSPAAQESPGGAQVNP
jgi:hypothetical protein